VLVDAPTEGWREINSAEDVAESYDPTEAKEAELRA
jgi:hypothetical protein